MMSRILIFDWAGAVKLAQYGYQHNSVVEDDLYNLINFFLKKDLKVMVTNSNDTDYEFMVCVDNRMFSQR